jgi:stage II sporulation protein D
VAKAKAAVKETEGMILLSSTGETLKAFYHSDCGGKTSNAKDIWGAGTSTGVAVDSFCQTPGRHDWKLELSRQEISQKLARHFKKDFGILQMFSLIRPQSDERVQKMELQWESGEKTKISAHEFRAALGFDQLRSTLFEAQKNGDLFQFTGRGYGHGVGMCQWGARAMGKLGKSHEEILGHYYPQAELRRGLNANKLQAKNEPELAMQIK